MNRVRLALFILPTLPVILACSSAADVSTPPETPKACSPLQAVIHQAGLVPDDIEVSPDGSELWVASTDRSSVLRFDASRGTPLEPAWIDSIPFPWALGIGPPGSPFLWVAETNAGKLHAVDPSSRSDTVVLDSLHFPMDIAFDAKGRLTLCESKGAILAFTESWVTRFDGAPGDPSTKSVLLSGLSGACDITYAPDGSLYAVAGNSTFVTRIRESGRVNRVPVDVQSPTDIVYHSATGGLLVAQLDEVVWINPVDGHSVRVACEGISHAEDLAVAPNGTVYLSESLGAEVSRFELIPEAKP